jgi:hypothetical protein
VLTLEQIKRLLKLEPLAPEGGFFAETYRTRETLAAGALPALGASRPLATAIYYLLEPGTFSALHRLRSDEVYHFYLGDPVEMLLLESDGRGRVLRLGSDLVAGLRPQAMVPAGVWQGSRLVSDGQWALLGTTMAPGYDDADFELGSRAELAARWPAFRELIGALTRG